MTNRPNNRKKATRRQHYVWRHYLEAWQDNTGYVSCLRDDAPFVTNPANIMVQRDFYKLSSISKTDVVFFELFLEKISSTELRALNRKLAQTLAVVANANELIQADQGFSDAEKRAAQDTVLEAEEMLHSGIEHEALPILSALRQKNVSFLADQKPAAMFFHFMAQQYFRTKKIREIVGRTLSTLLPDQDFSNLKNLLCHSIATNVGASLYVDRHHFEIVFLENDTDRSFITGDQPIINLMGTRDDSAPEEVAFYYPLAPRLAIILLPKVYRLRPTNMKTFVGLNDLIAWESSEVLVSRSAADLERYRIDRKALVPPTWQDLAQLDHNP